MKTSLLLALAVCLGVFSVMADALEIPAAVLERHQASCPDFSSPERGEYLLKESFTLPGSEYSPKTKTLYLLGCEMYAYNSLEKAYIVDSYGQVTNVSVVEVGSEGSLTATSDLMGAGFDLETLTLGTFSKGRGIGDCGSSASYKYDSKNEKFVLIEARLKEACDGLETDWPLVYKK